MNNSWDSEPVVIVVAPTGAEVTRAEQPALPHTPEEIAEATFGAVEAGAALVHLHVREPDGKPSARVELWRETVDRIRQGPPVITMVSTGGSVDQTLDERLNGLAAAPDLAGIETGSLNFGDDLFLTSRPDSLRVAAAAAAADIPLEVEAFDLGHIHAALRMHANGELPGPLRFNLVFGVPGGVDATPASLYAMTSALPAGARWTVTAIGRHQRRMVALGVLHGATAVRVGFEDNVFRRRGVLAASNAELVADVADLITTLGRRPATYPEACALLDVRPRKEITT
ncbi:3-keto-5-aminohexanoate cleavage protein [Nocardia sp. NPDC059246]|uniref:3-keto-5-aminohexanoate cleavage protein n=1 Tax=unclassified Nocardia TaxID=2637762 RepID=UPI00369D2D01